MTTGDVHPLSGLLVVDLSDGIPGAYCAKQLADGGAEVVRLEPPQGVALREFWQGEGALSDEDGALFQFLACSTKSVTVDLDRPSDLEMAEKLLASSDVIIWSLDSALGGMNEMSPAELHQRFPTAIVVAITPFGLDGPWAERPASDITIQAWAGAATLGRDSRPPVQWGGRVGQWLGGIFAAVGVLAARRRQAATGWGDLLDISLMETIAFCSGMYQVTRRTMSSESQVDATQMGPNRQIIIPMIERSSDGWVGFMVATAEMWEGFSVMLGHPEWIEDSTLYAYAGRAARRAELELAISEWAASHTTAEILELSALLRVPAAPIGNGETVTRNEHFANQHFYIENPRSGWLQPDVPYSFSGSCSRRAFLPAPRLGADTATERSARRRSKSAPSYDNSSELPLAGLRVADFTAFWAGPVVGHFLAMMGAEVIHVESPRHPDGIRGHSVKTVDDDRWWEWSPSFHGPNTNKLGVTINMAEDEGRRLARRLIAQCDIVIENYSPRVFEQWGLDYEAIRGIRPDAIFMRMPAFGLTGPWRDRNGYAQTMEQVSGIAWMTGFTDGHPQVLSGTCDPLAGMHAAAALLMAIEHRSRTGQGQQVEIAMVGGALNVMAEQVLEHQAYDRLLSRTGNRGTGSPQGLYRTADPDRAGRLDRWVAIAVDTDSQWKELQVALGNPSWAAEPSFETEDGRRQRHDEIDEQLTAWCATRSTNDIVKRLWAVGVPVGAVVPGYLGDDLEQNRARGFYQPVTHPVTGTQLHMGFPVRFARGPASVHRTPAPTLGQHNDKVFRELLGLSIDEMTRLEVDEVIGTRLLGDHRTR